MNLELEVLNPLNYRGWDDLLISNQDYSFFHSSSWAQVLYKSYKYTPLYFTSVDNDHLSALIPVMEIKSILTGRRGISLPFSDYCGLIISEKSNFQDVINYLIKYGKRAGWKFLELRDGKGIPEDFPPSSFYYVHTLDLSENEDQIFPNFHSSTKRNIKKAIREGVEVNLSNSLGSIKEFYRLNCMTRKKHGLPPQPQYFFKNMFDHIISKNRGFVALASYKGKSVAGAVYFHFGRKAVYKYGASHDIYRPLGANSLVMWEAIKWYSQNRYASLCLGRTTLENLGLRRFKSGWGAEERIIKYFRYDLRLGAFMRSDRKEAGLHNKLFSRMPVVLLRMIGSLLYRHIG